LIDYYSGRGLLINIDGAQQIERVWEQIAGVLA